MSTSVSVTPYAAASRRARSVSSALAAPEPKYLAVNAWGGASLASAQLATPQLATTGEESGPPLKTAAPGTSLTRWAWTDSSSQSATCASTSRGVGVRARGRSQYCRVERPRVRFHTAVWPGSSLRISRNGVVGAGMYPSWKYVSSASQSSSREDKPTAWSAFSSDANPIPQGPDVT